MESAIQEQNHVVANQVDQAIGTNGAAQNSASSVNTPPSGQIGTPAQQQKEYLDCLFRRCTEGFIEFRQMANDGRRDRCWIPVCGIQLPKILADANVYVGVATRREYEGDRKAILQIPAVWVDVDFKETPEQVAQAYLDQFKLKPSIQVHSGNGWHLYWLLATPAGPNDIPRLESVNRRLAHYFSGDKAAHDASRILRLPSTMNVKYTPPLPAKLLMTDPTRLYRLVDFDFLPSPTPPLLSGPASLLLLSAPATRELLPAPSAHQNGLQGVSEGHRNTRAAQLTGHFLCKGLPIEEIRDILALWNKSNTPPLPEREFSSVIDSIYRKHNAEKSLTIPQKSVPYTPDPDISAVIETAGIGIADLISMQLKEKPLILNPWLREGDIALIAADRGVGKTWLGLSIAMAVTHGLKIGKWETENHVGCVYIDGEMAGYQLQARFIELLKSGLSEKAPFELFSADLMRRKSQPAPNLGDRKWREGFQDYLRKHEKFKVVILDNLVSLTPGIDENPRMEWDPLNQWLLSLRSLGVAVIMIHHTGKSGDQRGTSAREDNIDISIVLTHPRGYQAEDGARFNVNFTKNRNFFGEDAETCCLHLKKTPHGSIWKVEDLMQSKAGQIIALLDSGLKHIEIAKMVGCKSPYVTQVKKEAIEKGFMNDQEQFTEAGKEKYGDIDINRLMESN
jgi:putative DNA primase/helicase